MAALKALGIERQQLLTGDRQVAARRIAEQTGILELASDMLPAEKLHYVNQTVRGECPMVVGDGINDALALKAGAVGIAMGSNGADIALASADLVLTGSAICVACLWRCV